VTYIIRNTIILGVVLFVIAAAGSYLTLFSMPRKVRIIDADIKKIETELQNTPDLANTYNTLNAHLEETKKHWDTRSKDVPPRDITGETYGVLNRIIEESGDVKLDMRYVGPKDSKNFGFNVYSLKGEATFPSFYNFIWFIENGRRLFKISNIGLKGYETKDAKTGETVLLVQFELDLEAYYSTIPELNLAPSQQPLAATAISGNPFYPLILRDLPAAQPGEIEIERSDLKAVIPGKAFVVDQNQKTRTLEEGDPVYLGYVTRIMPDQGKIECLLNKGGVSEKVEISIRVGQPIK